MLGQVKKIMPPDFGARFGAWWDGREYEPLSDSPADAEAVGAVESGETGRDQPDVSAPEPAPPPAAPLSKAPAAPGVLSAPESLRIRALETLWGEGRYSPSSEALDQRMLDALFEGEDAEGDLGFIGADASLLNACRARSERTLHAAEWRAGCADRSNQLVPGIAVMLGEVDRPKGLPEGKLGAALSIDAFAYADHKAGLVARVFRALGPRGRWVAVDTIRHTRKAPSEPFASAFAEPMLAAPEEISELLEMAGFRSVSRIDLTAQVLAAASDRYAHFAAMLEDAVRNGVQGRDGALFLQELSWEAKAWRSRMRALEGGALTIEMWVADKSPDARPAEPAAPPKPAKAASSKPAPAKAAPAKPAAPKPVPAPAAAAAKPSAAATPAVATPAAAPPVAAAPPAPAPVEAPAPAPAPAPADDDLDWDLGGDEPMDQSAVDSLFD